MAMFSLLLSLSALDSSYASGCPLSYLQEKPSSCPYQGEGMSSVYTGTVAVTVITFIFTEWYRDGPRKNSLPSKKIHG